MATSHSILWGIHAGRTGDADHLFLVQNVIALGWEDAGDLSKLPPRTAKDISLYVRISFHPLDGKEICRITGDRDHLTSLVPNSKRPRTALSKCSEPDPDFFLRVA